MQESPDAPAPCSTPTSGFCCAVILLACLAAFALRVIPRYSFVFLPTKIVFQETDAYYHMRHVEHLVHNFPDRFDWDPYGCFPNGQASYTGPLFDYLLATLIWITGLGAPGKQWMETVAVWFPAVLGALVPIAVFFLGRALFSTPAGLIAGCLIAVLPGHYLRVSSLGFTDHHVLETLTSCLALFCLVRLLQSEGDSARQVRRWTIWFGLALGAYGCTWVGGAIITGLFAAWTVAAALFRHWRQSPTAPLCRPVAVAFLIALLLFLPAYGVRWSEFTVLALAGGAAAIIAISTLSTFLQARRAPRLMLYLLLAGAGALGLAILVWRIPSLARQAFQLLDHLNPHGAYATINELQPLLRPGLLATANEVWKEFTTAGFLAALVLWWLLSGLRLSSPQSLVLFLFYSVFMMADALLQKRICYYAVIPVAVLTGHACAAALGSNRVRCTLVGIAVALGVLAPNIAQTVGNPVPRGGPRMEWLAALAWLRTNTPDPFLDPQFPFRPYPDSPRGFSYPPSAYSIMTWWDDGHWINYESRRIPVSNPHQQGAETAARFYLAQNEAEASAIMDSVKARYVMADPILLSWTTLEEGRDTPKSKIQPLTLWAGYQNRHYDSVILFEVLDGMYEPRLIYHPGYYRTMAARLSLFNGKAVTPANSTWVITTKPRQSRGITVPQLASSQRFATYAEAAAFLAHATDATAQLVGLDPKASCVPLEAVGAFHLEFDAKPNAPVDELPGLKVFSYSKPAAAPEPKR